MAALLVCADAPLARAVREEILEQCAALRAAGVNVVWLTTEDAPARGFAPCQSAGELDRAWEQEQTPMAVFAAEVPAWLAEVIAGGDFDRVLILYAGEEFAALERELARALVAAGAEAVELAPRAGLADLSQSWISGRRTPSWDRL